MKLFLSGGGSGEKSAEVDKKYIEAINKIKPILYIPIAIDTNKHPYSECLEWIRGNFARYYFGNFVMWTEDDLKNKTEQDLKEYMRKYNIEKVIAIPEDAGLYINEKEIRAIGPNTITIFTKTSNKLIIKPGELIL